MPLTLTQTKQNKNHRATQKKKVKNIQQKENFEKVEEKYSIVGRNRSKTVWYES
jgi:hypothetical protein